jgi:TatD DNase family protein
MMIETDSPYLAPVPYRGKRNEPAFVVEVAKQIAEVKGISLEEVDLVTTQNAVAFFDLPRVG